MRDPLPTIPWLSEAVTPFSNLLGLTTLPLHAHEVLLSFTTYTIIYRYLAPAVSTWLFPEEYRALSPTKRLNWNVHCVSLCQSTMINIAALYVMFNDEQRWNMDWRERVWGYTGAAGLIQGLAAGYFLWDLVVTLQHVHVFGLGMLAHAVSALAVFSFGFRPFINFYGCTFILYELSTPFLNFHWFFDKLGKTGTKPQLINGVILLVVFFSCRLVWGTYQSVRVFQDIWRALHHAPAAEKIAQAALNNGTNSALPGQGGIMEFAGEEFVPVWLALTYLGSNIILNTLNFFWFGKMVDAIRKRFVPAKESKKEKPVALKVTGSNGTAKVNIDQTEVRRRVVVDDPVPPAH